ncbi:hypothetical protein GCM10011349_43740 [Novosphingobium indicum]|mgnify:FL=1|uniref:SnoaL-like domain-containing protein n=1 Tax=Novosphingobium indicum TaxID=462949 RepID=A0ABQ2K1F3_9SPHN|nr:nuclear transport factor 2 family protein [Novosphingobium indicum]GGN61277.1 hypothetical protein GCM10011349_43740 [Novosphingobium indicum]|tara:strand:+ start:617 stop:952 length:336 start_codon:yes stop_codon:yes gene_type:complete
MNPTDLADRYFACIREKNIDGLAALYEDDATFILPDGRAFEGKSAIREMHLDVFAAGSPVPSPINKVVGQNSIAVEIEARLPDGTIRNTANFYELSSAGRIRRLSVYMRGG